MILELSSMDTIRLGMKNCFLPLFLSVLFSFAGMAQAEAESEADTATVSPKELFFLESAEVDGEIIPMMTLADIAVVAPRFSSKEEASEYFKTMRRVRKVYPYLVMGREILAELDSVEVNARRKRHYRSHKKERLSEMKKIFNKELKAMTTSEGKILVKLINRSTGNNCYRLIKELKGGMAAAFWQMIGKRYGYDLKEYYDPALNNTLELVIEVLGNENPQHYQF